MRKIKSVILEIALKGATLNKTFIMSRTRNLITIARATIADNARRQMSLMRSSYARLLPTGRKNRCQMPNPKKNDFRFMGHRI